MRDGYIRPTHGLSRCTFSSATAPHGTSIDFPRLVVPEVAQSHLVSVAYGTHTFPASLGSFLMLWRSSAVRMSNDIRTLFDADTGDGAYRGDTGLVVNIRL